MPTRVRPRPTLVALAALLATSLAATTVAAQERPGFDIQNFDPALGPHAIYSTERSGTLGHLEPAGQLVLDYASEPLVQEMTGQIEPEPIVEHQFRADLAGGIGLLDRGQVALHLPLYLVNDAGLAGEDLASTTIGDLAVEPKYTVYAGDTFGFAGALDVTFPTGRGEAFVGSRTVTAQPKLIGDATFGRAAVAANLGFLFQGRDEFRNYGIGHQFTYRLGGQYEFVEDLLTLNAEMFGRTRAGNFFGSSEESPLEMLLGAEVDVDPGIVVSAAAGGGVVPGVGAPEFRAIVGVGYPGRRSDPDGDGISGDECPNKAEDLDGFEDDDGCPDPDNDQDGIPDTEDECPNKAEDRDGFEDEDGCPDPDNASDDKQSEAGADTSDDQGPPDADGDGLPDSEDECPDKAEDGDGFEDGDGCPDPDNDQDGIPDAEDECPNEPGLRVNDGCPAEEKKAVLEEDRIVLREQVYFDTDSDDLKEKSRAPLQAVALVLRTHPDIEKVHVEGHTDSSGSDEHNQKLSERRAQSVVDYLVDKEGISRDRLEPKGYGASRPLVPNISEENRAKNRRVVFEIVEGGESTSDSSGEETSDSSGESSSDGSAEDSSDSSGESSNSDDDISGEDGDGSDS